jgi:hypothetical protein
MLGVDMKDARWRSAVMRAIPSVAESCAEEIRASCWKKVVAFFESRNAAVATTMPAAMATSSSTSVKPRAERRAQDPLPRGRRGLAISAHSTFWWMAVVT